MTFDKTKMALQKERLLRRVLKVYPKLRVGPIKDVAPSLDYQSIFELNQRSWADTYAARRGFEYSTGYFAWAYGDDSLNSPISIAATDDSRLVGVLLHAQRRIMHNGKNITAGMPCSLSISPEYKGRSLAQLLSLYYLEQASDQLDAIFVWFDASRKQFNKLDAFYNRMYGPGLDLAKHAVLIGTCPFRMKTHDLARMCAITGINIFQAFLVRMVMALSGLGSRKMSGQVSLIDPGCLREAMDFANSCSAKDHYGRLFTEKEFEHYVSFKYPASDFHSIGAVLRLNGCITGMAVGHPLTFVSPDAKRDTIFFLDSVVYDPQCPNCELKGFLNKFLKMAQSMCDPCCTMTMCKINMSTGYVPTDQRIVCFGLSIMGELKAVDDTNPVQVIDFR